MASTEAGDEARDGAVTDALFEVLRLAEVYDPIARDRADLDAYVAAGDEFGAASGLDIGGGTSTIACLLAQRGKDVTAVDRSAATSAVARRKAFAGKVKWLHD